MRKAKWVAVAAATSAVLLVAGCGGEGGKKTDAGKVGASGSSAGSGDSGGSLDAAAVTKEIETAATAAGFAKKAGDDMVPAALKACMVDWSPDAKKATDSKGSYDATVTALTTGGWKESQKFEQQGSVVTSLDKSGWTLKASYHGQQKAFVSVSFVAVENGPVCAKLFAEDLEKGKETGQ
ncbi:hypothetical protein [Streptomyces sp. NPDC006307]|uniref:hypothetical protein n=1 Tax=Streptomyces sp. NPDC006307 TaxID=3156748 RepID=UPI0033A69D77